MLLTCHSEVTGLILEVNRPTTKVSSLPVTLAGYPKALFWIFQYYMVGENILDYLLNSSLADGAVGKWLQWLLQYHEAVSFTIYIASVAYFISQLDEGNYIAW